MDEQPDRNAKPDERPHHPDDAMLRELALALVVPQHSPLASTAAQEPQLLVGQMPPQFPGDIIVPPGARILGSLVAADTIVVLDTDQPGEDVIEFYRTQLATTGWLTPDPVGFQHGGFLHAGMADRQFGTFYREAGPSLHVMAHRTSHDRTIVHLTLTPGGGEAMHRRVGPGGMREHNPWRVLPPIAPPPRSEQYQEGGTGGDERVSTSARVESDADLATLTAHYTAQLQRAGWRLAEDGAHDPTAWSAWTFADENQEPWRALFVIVRWPGVPRRFWAHLLAEWVGKKPRGGAHVEVGFIGWQAHTAEG